MVLFYFSLEELCLVMRLVVSVGVGMLVVVVVIVVVLSLSIWWWLSFGDVMMVFFLIRWF